MNNEERIISEVGAALERETAVNLHHFPVYLSFEANALVVEGEVEGIAAKKRALEVTAAIPGVTGIVDRLHVVPAEPMEDGVIREHVCKALLAENLLTPFAVRATVKGVPEPVGGGDGSAGTIDVEVNDGVVVLDGTVPSLSAKRLAGVLAWWVPGSRDVVNGIEVAPYEEDNDDELVDAIRLVLEKDPFVNAAQIRVTCRNYAVTLDGIVKGDTQRRMAEADCWYVFDVDRVTNRLQIEV